MNFKIHSFRRYGEKKLEKPSELKNMTRSFIVDYIPKRCSYKVFVLKDKDEIWIKADDWFSPQWRPPDNDIGQHTDYYLEKYFPGSKVRSKKFIYSDNWSSIVLRQEAWILFTGIFNDIVKYNEYKSVHMFHGLFPTEIYITNGMLRCVEKHYDWDEYNLDCSDLSRCFEKIVKNIIKL